MVEHGVKYDSGEGTDASKSNHAEVDNNFLASTNGLLQLPSSTDRMNLAAADGTLGGKVGNLTLVSDQNAQEQEGEETDADDHPDADDHVDAGKPITWSPQLREKARPKEGQGYYDVMKAVGEELLGRKLSADELKLLINGATALQIQRGKDPTQLTSRDELLPKNENELNLFFNNMDKVEPGKISERQKFEFMLSLYESLHSQSDNKVTADQIVLDLKPVNDQPEVTKVVKNAVYIDNSHIEGGQGYRRKLDCSTETQTYWLSKPTAEALMRAQDWLIKNGKDPIQLRNMNGAGRRAIDRELIKKCAPNQPHAKKRSQHEDGISIDVDNYDNPDVRKAIEKEGFVHNVPGDRPHFTWFGKK